MTISIITVTYNSAATLRDTMQSVLSQTYPDMEYIVVDGSSTDRTVDIIRQYEPRFQGKMHWISEPDRGIYDAMNKGIALATGDIVGILNSDDIFMDHFVLSDIADAFATQQTESVHGNLYFVKNNDLNHVTRVWKSSSYFPGAFTKGWHPAHPAFYVKRECYERYGGFDIAFAVSADFELMLRFFEKYGVSNYYLDRFIVKMRLGGESTKSILKIIQGNRNVMRAFKKNGIIVSAFYPFVRLIPKALDFIKHSLHIK